MEIISACIKDKNGMIYTGRTHKEIIREYFDISFDVAKKLSRGETRNMTANISDGKKGFLSDDGNFCSREQSRIIADESGQVLREMDEFIADDKSHVGGKIRHDYLSRGLDYKAKLFSEQVEFTDEDIKQAEEIAFANNDKILQEKGMSYQTFLNTHKMFKEHILKDDAEEILTKLFGSL